MKIITGQLLLLLAMSSSLFAQTNAKFRVVPELIKPGDTITIFYDASDGLLEDRANVTGRMASFDNWSWQVQDLQLTRKSKNQWETTVVLGAHTALISCVFESDSLLDDGGLVTYSWMIPDEPGAYLAWGMLRNKTFQDEVPNIVNDSAYIDDSVMKFWINNELKYHPESHNKLLYEGLKLMTLTRKGDHTERIKSDIRYFLSQELDVMSQFKLQKVFTLLSSDHLEFIDSVKSVLVEKYPDGVLARDDAMKTLFLESDLELRTQHYMEFEKQFPEERFDNIITYNEELYHNKMILGVAYTRIIKHNDYSFALDRLQQVNYDIVKDFGWHMLNIPYQRDMLSKDTLKWLADAIVPELERRELIVPKSRRAKLSPLQWQQEAQSMAASEYLVYAQILFEFEEYEKTKHYLNKVRSLYGSSNAECNELYTRLLLKTGQEEAAIGVIKESLRANNATPAMLEILKENYLADGGKSTGFDSYLQGIKSSSALEEQRNHLISELIDEPIAGFDLEMMGGGKANLAEQRGKIVVLDFWATWCVPCKKAMPGMQLAATKYAEDDDVVFYFVDTQEYTKNYREKVASFIKEKGYTFNVLYDGQNEESGKMDDTYSKYAKAFQFSGIPQKMIIDQKGNLRWRSTGYYGSPTQLADEISMLIEYLKSEG